MKVLGIIPARGGSKGIPRKNIKNLNGKPLIKYTIESALKSEKLSQVIVSTEDEEIAQVAETCGACVPFLRPKEIAKDATPMLPVVQHAVSSMEEKGFFFDAICLLQPTNPLRRFEDIDTCIDLLKTSEADSVISVIRVPDKYNPHWIFFQNEKGFLQLSTREENPIPRRQELPPAFHREGSIYITRHEILMKKNSLYGKKICPYSISPQRNVNIDDPEDWALAERLLKVYDY